MANTLLLSVFFLICMLFAAFRHKKRRQQQHQRKPPSPPGLPIIGNLHQIGELPHQSLWRLSRKYGPVMLLKLGRVSTLIVSSSETAEQVLRVHDLHCCSRPCSASTYIKYHEALEVLGSFSASDFFPYVGWIIDWFTGLQGRRERSVRGLDAFYEQMFDMHTLEKEKGNEDFIDLLLRLEKEQTVLGDDKLTRNHIKGILMNILLAGIDTTVITMTWAMAELARNPRVMRKVQSEIQYKFGNRELISFADTEHLDYLKMVVKETWRLHPTSPLLLPREVMSEFELNGYTIQLKTRLHVNVWAIGRDPDTWKDTEEFLPERFMDSDIDPKGQSFELLPFGSGRRICPGMYMGTTVVEFGLANMLYHFDWTLPEGTAVDLDEAPGLTVNKKVYTSTSLNVSSP